MLIFSSYTYVDFLEIKLWLKKKQNKKKHDGNMSCCTDLLCWGRREFKNLWHRCATYHVYSLWKNKTGPKDVTNVSTVLWSWRVDCSSRMRFMVCFCFFTVSSRAVNCLLYKWKDANLAPEKLCGAQTKAEKSNRQQSQENWTEKCCTPLYLWSLLHVWMQQEQLARLVLHF